MTIDVKIMQIKNYIFSQNVYKSPNGSKLSDFCDMLILPGFSRSIVTCTFPNFSKSILIFTLPGFDRSIVIFYKVSADLLWHSLCQVSRSTVIFWQVSVLNLLWHFAKFQWIYCDILPDFGIFIMIYWLCQISADLLWHIHFARFQQIYTNLTFTIDGQLSQRFHTSALKGKLLTFTTLQQCQETLKQSKINY